jgi:hypothetical protein
MRTIRKRNWFLRRIVLGFAVAAFAVPAAAQARVDEGGAAGSSKNTELRVILDPPPSGQSSWPGVDPTSEQSYPVWPSSTEVVSEDGGFGWDDAGVGGGIALGIVLLGGAAVRFASHRGQTQTA